LYIYEWSALEYSRAWMTHLGIGVSKLDGDIPHEFVFESDGHDTRYGLDHGGFSVSDMADRTYSTM
jgi:hypothetical protein